LRTYVGLLKLIHDSLFVYYSHLDKVMIERFEELTVALGVDVGVRAALLTNFLPAIVALISAFIRRRVSDV